MQIEFRRKDSRVHDIVHQQNQPKKTHPGLLPPQNAQTSGKAAALLTCGSDKEWEPKSKLNLHKYTLLTVCCQGKPLATLVSCCAISLALVRPKFRHGYLSILFLMDPTPTWMCIAVGICVKSPNMYVYMYRYIYIYICSRPPL